VRNYTSSQCTPLDHMDADLEPECLDVQASGSGSNTFAPNSTCGGIALYKGRCVVSQQGAFSDISPEEVEPVLATRLQRSGPSPTHRRLSERRRCSGGLRNRCVHAL